MTKNDRYACLQMAAKIVFGYGERCFRGDIVGGFACEECRKYTEKIGRERWNRACRIYCVLCKFYPEDEAVTMMGYSSEQRYHIFKKWFLEELKKYPNLLYALNI